MTANDADAKAFHDLEHAAWEERAVPYNEGFGGLTTQIVGPLLDAVGAGRGVRLLDVASGPGYVAAAAAQRGASGVGLDFSSAMVALASRNHPDIEFKQGDAQDLPFQDGSFDAVTMNFGLLHLAEPERAIAEAYRVLRPGGRFGFTVWATPQHAKGFDIVLRAVEQHGSTNVGLPPGPPFFRFSDPQETVRCLLEAGFKDPAVVQVPLAWRFDSLDSLFTAMYEGTARTAALLRAQSEEALQAIREAIRQGVAAYEQDGKIEVPMPAMLASAMK